MIFKIFLFVLLALCGSFTVHGQDDGCVPNTVLVLLVSANATLSWVVHPREPCEITGFIVDIVGDKEDSYVFSTTETYVDVSFLNICELWTFTVTPVSHSTRGYSRTLTHHIPLPQNADLSLKYFNISHIDDREVLLEWDLNDHTHGDCTLQYRLSIEDEELGTIQDVYVTENSIKFSFVTPCVPYQIGIRAINRAYPTIEGPLRVTEFELPPLPQNIPILQDVAATPTSINLVWILEGNANRCPLKSLHIESANNFNITIPLMNSLNPEPVPVELKNLQPNKMYFMNVYVENSGGISRPFPIAVQTPELNPDF